MTQLRSIPIELIDNSPHNPRHNFSEESLVSLANSISQLGVLQPILVKEIPESERFEIIAGERRWRASKIANIETIPAIVVSMDEPTIHEVQLIENLEREQLNPIDEARAFRSLMENFDYSYAELARKLKRSYQFIRSRVDLLTLDDRVQLLVAANKITMSVALELTKLKDPETQYIIAQEVENEGLTALAVVTRINSHKFEQKTLENKKARRLSLAGKQELLEAEGTVITPDTFDPNIHHRIWDLSFPDCRICQLKGKFLRSDLHTEEICVQPSCYGLLLAKQRHLLWQSTQDFEAERRQVLEKVLEGGEVTTPHLQYLLWTLLHLMGPSADAWRHEFRLAPFSDTSTLNTEIWNEIASWSDEKLLTNIFRLTIANIGGLSNSALPDGLRQSLICEFQLPQRLFQPD